MHRICNDILTSVKGCVCVGTLVLNEHTSSTSRACYACGNALHPFFFTFSCCSSSVTDFFRTSCEEKKWVLVRQDIRPGFAGGPGSTPSRFARDHTSSPSRVKSVPGTQWELKPSDPIKTKYSTFFVVYLFHKVKKSDPFAWIRDLLVTDFDKPPVILAVWVLKEISTAEVTKINSSMYGSKV